MSVRSRQLSIYLAVFCLALVACGDGEDDADPQPTTTSPSTTQSPEEADEQALRQLAEDWDGAITEIYLEEASEASADQYLAEPYLTEFQAQLEDFRATGNQIEVTDRSGHQIESVDVEADAAAVIECVIDGDILRDQEGTVLNDAVEVKRYSTSAQRTAEGWRFTDRTTLPTEEGEVCAGA